MVTQLFVVLHVIGETSFPPLHTSWPKLGRLQHPDYPATNAFVRDQEQIEPK
jgi:hypothetical protein